MFAVAGVCVVLLIIVMLIPVKKVKPAAPEPFDPMADGFPVPPLPGQELPPSPRSGLLKVTPSTPAETAITGGKEEK